MSHTERLSVQNVDPDAYKPMLALEKYIHSAGLDEGLIGQVKIRASQLNGCAFCLDMHGREARTAGVDQRKLDVLAGWREAPELYTDRERAALGLTESVTLIGEDGVPDEVWTSAASAFDEREIVVLLMAIGTINMWNRLAVATHQRLPEL